MKIPNKYVAQGSVTDERQLGRESLKYKKIRIFRYISRVTNKIRRSDILLRG